MPELQRLFEPIGLGNLVAVYLAYENNDGVSVSLLNEKNAAKPHDGNVWIVAEVLFGHFNGPKRHRVILTDGDQLIESTSIDTIFEAIKHNTKPSDISAEKYVLARIKETIFGDLDGDSAE